jgi:hypothetical protein
MLTAPHISSAMLCAPKWIMLAEACLLHPAVIEADVLVEKPGALADGVAGARVVLTKVTRSSESVFK